MQTITDTTFKAEIENHKGLTLVDFKAIWCGPCRMLAPILEELATEMPNKVKIVIMDVEGSPNATLQFSIRSVPCLILFKDGQEIDRKIGAHSKNDIKGWIESHC